MKIKSVKLGRFDVTITKFLDFIKDSNLKSIVNIEVDMDEDSAKFLSLVQNIRMLPEGDERITKLNRPFLYTWALTKEQQKKVRDWFEANHITVEFEQSMDQWKYATESEETYKARGGV